MMSITMMTVHDDDKLMMTHASHCFALFRMSRKTVALHRIVSHAHEPSHCFALHCIAPAPRQAPSSN